MVLELSHSFAPSPLRGCVALGISLLSAPFHEEGKGQHLRGLQGLVQLLGLGLDLQLWLCLLFVISILFSDSTSSSCRYLSPACFLHPAQVYLSQNRWI